jgi:phosphate transport system protein
MRATFQQELSRLEDTLQEMGDYVARAIRSTLNALDRRDLELADEVIAFDDDVDRLYLGVELGIESLLARQAPVATDLRLVLAILHVNLHLERAADLCVTIAKLVKLAHDAAPNAPAFESFEDVGGRAEEMLRVAMRSFSERDLASAESLVDLDELIDEANRRIVSQVLERGADPSLHEWGMRMIIISRCFERIGDHCVDIGEQTAYLVTGEFREFTDASHPVPEPRS